MKKLLYILLLTGFFTTQTNSQILVIVNKNLFPFVEKSVLQFINDLSMIEGKPGWYNYGTFDETNTPQQLKDFIHYEWSEEGGIEGVILIGDLPIAEYEIENDFGTYGYARFPIDLYYTDFNGTWSDNAQNGAWSGRAVTGVFDSHTGLTKPEIWLSRIVGSIVPGLGLSEAQVINNYLAKVHNRMIGADVARTSMLTVANDIEWRDAVTWAGQSLLKYSVHDAYLRTNNQDSDTNLSIRLRTQNMYDYAHIIEHAWANGFLTSRASYLSATYLDSGVTDCKFYNLFACSNARYTESDFLGGLFAWGHNGLISVGSTKTGAMLGFDFYNTPLGNGSSFGESFLSWFNNYSGSSNIEWHYGMTLLGAGNLKLGSYNVCNIATPSNVTAEALSNGIQISWSAVTGASSYVIKRSTNYDNGYLSFGTVYAPTTSFTDNNITAGITYYYTVYASNGQCASLVSTPVSSSAGIPAAPSNLVATAVSSNQINLVWNDNSSNENYFNIDRATSPGGPFLYIASLYKNINSYQDDMVEPNTTYWYRVWATNMGGAGISNYSNLASAKSFAQTLGFSDMTYSVNENGGSVTLTVNRLNGSNGTASATYTTANGTALAGSDYTAKNGTLTFAPGVISQPISISITDDAVSEGGESFTVVLSGAAGGATIGSFSSAMVTITDNDVPALSLPGRVQAESYNNGGEGVGYHDLSAGNTGGAYRNDNVDIETTVDQGGGYDVGWTQPGEWLDYSVTVQTTGYYDLTARMASGSTGTKTLTATIDGVTIGVFTTTDASGWQSWKDINVSNVYLEAGAHTLRMTMTTGGFNVNYLHVAPAKPGALQFSQPTHSVSENNSLVYLTIYRVNGLGGEVSVNYTTTNGSATAGSDYTSKNGTLTFQAGETYQIISVNITDDAISENSETFTVVLSGATGGATIGSPSTATVTITDNDVPALSLPGRVQAESYNSGGEGVGYHDLSTGNSGGAYRTDNVDIEATSDAGGGYDIGWTQAGEWLDFNVNVTTAGLYDLTARMSSGASGTKTMTVTLDGATIGTFSTTDASGWQSWKDVKVSNVNLTAGSHTLRMAMTTGGFNLNYLDITAPASIPGTLQFSASGYTVAESGGSVSLTVNRLNGSTGSVSVNYATANGSATSGSDYTSKSGTLTFAAGVTSQTISISITNDANGENNETFTVSLSSATGGATIGTPASTTVTITDNDDLAKSKTATASSTMGTTNTPAMAVDGSASTRWESLFSDPQWIRIDLGASYTVKRVVLNWERASAKDYRVEISSDGTTWTTMVTKTNMANSARVDDLTGLNGTGRYIRMYGTARTTTYGYSVYSFEAYSN